MSIGTFPQMPGMAVPPVPVKSGNPFAAEQAPQNSAPQLAAPLTADTVQFGGIKKAAAVVAGTGVLATFGFYQALTNPGFLWDNGGEQIVEHVINNAIRYPLGDGLIALSKIGSTGDTEHYMLNGMKVEGNLEDSEEKKGAFGGYADFVPEPGADYSKPEEKMLNFIQNTPLDQRVYLDPKDEENAMKIEDVHKRLSVELNMLDGTLQTVDYNGEKLVLAIQDQTGQFGDYAVYIKEIPSDIATPATLSENLEKVKEWSRQAIIEYKSVNAEKGGK